MATIIIEAKNFSSRKELEQKVGSVADLTPEPKPAFEIQGKREELERLRLSDRTTFYGIKCVITDFPNIIKTQKEVEKPQRGKIFPSGINNNITLNKNV